MTAVAVVDFPIETGAAATFFRGTAIGFSASVAPAADAVSALFTAALETLGAVRSVLTTFYAAAVVTIPAATFAVFRAGLAQRLATDTGALNALIAAAALSSVVARCAPTMTDNAHTVGAITTATLRGIVTQRTDRRAGNANGIVQTFALAAVPFKVARGAQFAAWHAHPEVTIGGATIEHALARLPMPATRKARALVTIASAALGTLGTPVSVRRAWRGPDANR